MFFEINENSKELTEHRIGKIPIAIYDRVLRKERGDELIHHWHEEFQLTFVLSGILEFTVEKGKFQVQKDMGMFINSRKLHHAVPLSEKVHYICLNFSPDFINKEIYQTMIKPIQEDQEFTCRLVGLEVRQYEILKEIVSKDREYNFLRIYELLLSYLDTVTNKAPVFNSIEDTYIYRLLDFVHQNFQKHITVSDIAQVIPLNKNKCTKLFKMYTGHSPIDYLLNYRLSRARELLLNTRASISEICYMVGFNNLSYFIHKFKGKYDISPKRFRKKFSDTI